MAQCQMNPTQALQSKHGPQFTERLTVQSDGSLEMLLRGFKSPGAIALKAKLRPMPGQVEPVAALLGDCQSALVLPKREPRSTTAGVCPPDDVVRPR